MGKLLDELAKNAQSAQSENQKLEQERDELLVKKEQLEKKVLNSLNTQTTTKQ